MKFKIDENLRIIADAKGESNLSVVARELCARFIDENMIELVPENFNVSVLQATGPQYVTDVCEALSDYLYGTRTRAISSDIFDAFCNLIVVPDGCPECGGELKFVETEGHELNDGDYYTPNSYVVDKYIYQCRDCGEIFKSEKEL